MTDMGISTCVAFAEWRAAAVRRISDLHLPDLAVPGHVRDADFSARRAYTRRSRQTSAVFAAAIDDAARFKQSRTAG